MDFEMAPSDFRLLVNCPRGASPVVLGVAGTVDDRNAEVLHDVVNLFIERGRDISVDLAEVESVSRARVSALLGTTAAGASEVDQVDFDPYPVDLNSF